MENASKALLIAGAVLIVVMILSLAIYFLGKYGVIENLFATKITDAEIKNHNNDFVVYEGEVTGTQVIEACGRVVQNNNGDGFSVKVSVQYKKSGTEYEIRKNFTNYYDTIINNVVKTKIYIGQIEYDKAGLINKLVFRPKS